VLESSNGQLLVIAQHDRFVAPCKSLTASGGQLASTGSRTALLLGLGAGLLLAGLLLLRTSRGAGRSGGLA
jgi:hypothetical protein